MTTSSGSRSRLAALFALLVAVNGDVARASATTSVADEPTPVRVFRSFDRGRYPGAPQATVGEMAQDRSGLLWIATTTSLLVFDGRTFEPRPGGPHAPPLGEVNEITSDRSGRVLVAQPAGISRWDGRGWTDMGFPGGAASVKGDDEDGLWAIGGDARLWHRAAAATRWSEVPVRPVGALVAGAGEVFALGGGAPLRLRRGRLPEPLGSALPPGAPLTAAAVAPDGTLWVTTRTGGLYHFRTPDEGWVAVDTTACERTFTRALTFDETGTLWIGDNASGLCFGRPETGAWTRWTARNGLQAAAILDLRFDREGTLWIAYNSVGLQQWIAREWSHRDRWDDNAPFPPRITVPRVAPSRGGFVAAVWPGGIWQWQAGRLARFGAADGIDGDPMAVLEDVDGSLLVGARFGVFERSARGGRFDRTLVVPGGFVSVFARSPAGELFAGSTASGIFRRTAAGWERALDLDAHLPDRDVRALLWSRSGALWVGTRSGVTIFERGAVRHLSAPGPGMPSEVCSLAERAPGEIWIAGVGGVRMVGKGKADRFLSAESLHLGEWVSALAPSPAGDVWLAGEGVTHMERDGTLQHWDETNGLLHAAVPLGALWVDRDAVYVGTVGGLARLATTFRAPALPPLQLTWRRGPGIAGERAPASRTGEWWWRAASLQPEPVEYRARVPGLYDDWLPTQLEPRLVLRRLPPGAWTLLVEARRRAEGRWSTPLSIGFVVEARWWETPAARAALVILVALAVAALVQLRNVVVRRRREQELYLQHLRDQANLAALRAQTRPHFLFNTLNGISSLVTREPLRARRMIARLCDLLRASLGHETDDEIPLAEELDLVRRYLELQQLRFEDRLTAAIDVDESLLAVAVPSFSLQTLVENAVRHGVERRGAGAAIEIRGELAGDRARLTVRDNGPGPSTSRDGALGLSNLRHRLATLHGDDHRLELRALSTGGAEAVFEVPLARRAVRRVQPVRREARPA